MITSFVSIPMMLGFAFGAPGLALAGALLASVPVIIHLLNRRRYKTHRWAAMQYLLEAMRINRRRLQFENWLLLALRCLAVALAGFALARPMGCSGTAAGHAVGQTNRLHVLIVDNSASMAYQLDQPNGRTCVARGKFLAGQILKQLGQSHDAVAIIPLSSGAAGSAASSTYDLDSAGRQLAQIEQTYVLPDLPGAFRQALTLAKESRDLTSRRLYIITNSARPTWESDRVAQAIRELGPELASQYELSVVDVGDKAAANSAVTDVRLFGSVALTSMPADFAAKATANSVMSESMQWTSGARVLGSTGILQLNPESPEQTLPQVAFSAEGPTPITARLDPRDRLPEDDQRSLVINVRKRLDVLVVEGDRGTQAMDSPATFLQLALSPEQGGSAEGAESAKVEVISGSELSGRPLAGRDVVILAAPSSISEADAQQLRRFVEDGGTLVFFSGEGMNLEQANRVLLPAGLLPGRLSSLMSMAEGQEPFKFDFRPDAALHPLLRIFRGEQNSGLATTRIFTYARVDLDPKLAPQRVLDFVGRDPAITAHSLGRGRVLFFATSADTRWTTLPAKPAFVAILHELLLGSVNADIAWANIPAGVRLEVPRRVVENARPTLANPTGQALALEPSDKPQTAYRSEVLNTPGLYRLQVDQRVIPVSVLFPAEASDVTHLDASVVRRHLGDVPLSVDENDVPANASGADDRSDFGWPLLVVALGVLMTEMFLAMWFRR